MGIVDIGDGDGYEVPIIIKEGDDDDGGGGGWVVAPLQSLPPSVRTQFPLQPAGPSQSPNMLPVHCNTSQNALHSGEKSNKCMHLISSRQRDSFVWQLNINTVRLGMT